MVLHLRNRKGVKNVTGLGVILCFLISNPAYPLPQIERVVNGDVCISHPDDSTLKIDAGDKSIITYRTFNIGEGERVIFNLAGAGSSVLNRVTGGIASQLLGSLVSNGLVVIINTSGIHIGRLASIDAHSLILSTRDITNTDFLNSNYLFKNTTSQDSLLLNEGEINIREGGFGVLIGGAIENRGIIAASLGRVVLAGGDAVKLDISGDGLISIVIDEKAAEKVYDADGNPITSQIKNTGTVEAEGGVVTLKAESLPGIFEKTINLEGVVRANRVEDKGGIIRIVASGNITSKANIEAEGGSIHLEGENIVSEESLVADSLYERGKSFHIGGSYNIKEADIENEDGAVNLGTGNYSGEIADTGDIIIDPSAVITLTGDTTFRADSDTDGGGSFAMSVGSSVVGGAYNLTLYSSGNSDLRSIMTGGLEINESKAGSNPTYTANNNIDVGSFSLNSGTFTAPSGSLTVDNGFAVASGATFTHNNGRVRFFINDTDYTIDASGVHFFNVEFNKSNGTIHTATINHDFTVEGDLTLANSTSSSYSVCTPSLTNVTLTVFGDLLIPDDGFSGEIDFGTNDPSGNIIIDLAGPTSSFEIHDSQAHLYSNVKFSGTGLQTINKTAGWTKYDVTWTIDKSSGEVRLIHDLGIINWSGNYFYLNNGTFNLDGYDLTSVGNFIQNGGTFDATTGSPYIEVRSFTLNGGTFNGGNANFNVTNGAFTMSTGTFNAPLYMNIYDGMAVTGGVFNHNNGHITFYANNYDYTIDTPYGLHFYDVEFHECPDSSADHTIHLTEGFIVDNDFTVRNLSTSGGSYTVDCVIPTIVVYGDVDFPDTGTGQLYFGSSSTHYPILRLAGTNSSLNLSDPDVHLFSDVEFSGSGTYNVAHNAGSIEGGTWSIYNSSAKVVLQNDLAGMFDLNLSNGEIDLNGYLLSATDFQQTGGTFTGAAQVTFNNFTQSAGTFDAPSGILSIGGDFNYTGGSFVHNSGTIDFTATDTGNTITTSGVVLNNVTFNGIGGEWQLQDNLDVGKNLAITAGSLSLNGKNLSLGGSFSNTGILKLEGAETLTGFTNDTDSGTVEYTGTGTYAQLNGGNLYYNLVVSGGGSYTASSDLDINGSFTQNSGTFRAPSGNMNVAGDFNHIGGIFIHNNGTVVLDGLNQQVEGNNTFYNFIKEGEHILTFQAGTTQVTEGRLTLKGTDSSRLLTLRSSHDGSYWNIDGGSNYDLAYLDVRDSNNLGGVFYSEHSIFTHTIGWLLPMTEAEVIQSTQSTAGADETLNAAVREDFENNASSDTGKNIAIKDNPVSTKKEDDYSYNFLFYVEGRKKYIRCYLKGEYRTTVIVFEGKVIVVPYDEKGIKIDKMETITAGQSAVQSGEVK